MIADQIIKELSNIEEILEVHEMHSRFDLFVKVRAKDLNHKRDIIENKIRMLPNVVKTELMTVLKSSKEEQIVSLNNYIAENDSNMEITQSNAIGDSVNI